MGEKTSGDKVKAELDSQARSMRALAEFAAIPEATLRRKLKTGDFTVKELGRIADALDVSLRDLLPDSLTTIATSGGTS